MEKNRANARQEREMIRQFVMSLDRARCSKMVDNALSDHSRDISPLNYQEKDEFPSQSDSLRVYLEGACQSANYGYGRAMLGEIVVAELLQNVYDPSGVQLYFARSPAWLDFGVSDRWYPSYARGADIVCIGADSHELICLFDITLGNGHTFRKKLTRPPIGPGYLPVVPLSTQRLSNIPNVKSHARLPDMALIMDTTIREQIRRTGRFDLNQTGILNFAPTVRKGVSIAITEAICQICSYANPDHVLGERAWNAVTRLSIAADTYFK